MERNTQAQQTVVCSTQMTQIFKDLRRKNNLRTSTKICVVCVLQNNLTAEIIY
ncbi:MAG: hypothetical protein LBJ00_14985 [Planctomycetaceae bacterium]|nr:hypothetical protein [Planctomycetaceae bacterium]